MQDYTQRGRLAAAIHSHIALRRIMVVGAFVDAREARQRLVGGRRGLELGGPAEPWKMAAANGIPSEAADLVTRLSSAASEKS